MIAAMRRVFSSQWAIAGGLFLLALVPRIIGLGSYVTHDEPFWLLNSIRCIYGLSHGNLGAAFQTAHPGVPPIIGYGSLLALYYAGTGRPDVIPSIAQSGWVILFPPYLYHLLPEMIAVGAWLTAVVSAATVALAYLLLCRVASGRTLALFAGLLLAVDPYFLALSRVVGVDAILAGFMLLAMLSLLVYLTEMTRTWALVSAAILTALAVLTKTSAAFLVLFTLLTLVAIVPYRLLTGRPAGWSGRRWLLMSVVWALVGAMAFLCLWPAAWQNPAATLGRLVRNVEAAATVPHESANYFLGQATTDPGWLYYWAVLLFRLTPVTLPLGLLAAGFLAADTVRRRWRPDAGMMLLMFLYAVLFLVMLSLAAKKQERYLLPAVLALDVLAAWALVRLLAWLAAIRRLRLNEARQRGLRWCSVGLILVVSLGWFRLHPHYYAYQNPLVGGSPAADWVYLTGWGEGNELAAAYLSQLPDAADLVTAASFDAGVGAYAPGVTLWLSPQTLSLADYVVVYEGSIRHDPTTAPLAGTFVNRQPVHTVYLNGIPYVQVYALTDAPRGLLSWRLPPIQHPTSVVVGGDVAFRGYDGDLTQAAAGDTLKITLYWQCLSPLSRDYTVFVHLIDRRTGQRWGQWDSIPVGAQFPTSWWLPGLVIRDDVTLDIDPGTPPGEYDLRIGMYDVPTSQRLWVGEKDGGLDSIELGTTVVTAPGRRP